MGLRELSKRLFAGRAPALGPVEGADPVAFLDRISARIPIGKAVPRQRATVAGFVLTKEVSGFGDTPKMTVILQDESGALEVVWQGRREVPGIEVGTALVVTGTVLVVKRVLRIIDPAYTILEKDTL